MRMTLATKRVLMCLFDAPNGDLYGFELGRLAGLPSGTVYPILHRLERARWITSYWGEPGRDGSRRRRYYKLSALGESKRQEVARADGGMQAGLKPSWSH
jgi:PadR family transcriptional regulator, regulatory protein PadR